jgi:hypothetical protein
VATVHGVKVREVAMSLAESTFDAQRRGLTGYWKSKTGTQILRARFG